MQIYSYYMHTAEVQPNLFNQVLYLTLYIVTVTQMAHF